MKKFGRLIFSVAVTFIFTSLLVFSVFAKPSENRNVFFENKTSVLSMAHRGNTAFYPANSLEAVLSSSEQGADMISISVRKTADDVLVLCEDKPLFAICKTDKSDVSAFTYDELEELKLYSPDGSVSDCTVPKLEVAIDALKQKSILVLDNAWENRDQIYEMCERLDAFESVVIRTNVSSKQIAEWVSSKGEKSMAVIGIYDGNIVFNAISHLSRLSQLGQPAVQFQSKNYFNVMYDSFTSKRYSSNGNARAVAPMYDKNLCGQRGDNVAGWDEMIERGFSVIETNNVVGLNEYISQCESGMNQLKKLFEYTKNVDTSLYSQVSVKNFGEAVRSADEIINASVASLGEIQQCISSLNETMSNLAFNQGEDLQKGNFNLSAGKVIAIVVFGGLILAGEIYVHKMQKPKKGRKH